MKELKLVHYNRKNIETELSRETETEEFESKSLPGEPSGMNSSIDEPIIDEEIVKVQIQTMKRKEPI
jgi:hypothetical protein